MAALVWIMMGIALWHFAIFVPDHFWSGIVGAFVGAVIGALLFGFLVQGLTVPGQNDTDLINALEAIPGAIAGMAVVYFIGRRDAAAGRSMPSASRSSRRAKKAPQPCFVWSYSSGRLCPRCSKCISVRPSPRSVRTTVTSS
jgi:hypothetical protein